MLHSSYDLDLLDLQDFGFPDPDPQKYVNPQIQIEGEKYQLKTAKTNFVISKPKTQLFKKREILKFPDF